MKKIVRKAPVEEEAPANSVGGGNIAGLGVGAKGEPGLNTKQRLSYKKKNQLDDKSREGQIATFIRRAEPVMEVYMKPTDMEPVKTPNDDIRTIIDRMKVKNAMDDFKSGMGDPKKGEILKPEAEKTNEEAEQPVSNVRRGKFAGNDTFIVPSDMFHKARHQKNKGKHWKTYIGEDEHGTAIREYANKNRKSAIVLEDEKTGAMCYARYGKR